MENGSEYRTLLKAFGIRFDVLVYGNVSPGTQQMREQGRSPGVQWKSTESLERALC